MAKFKIKRSHTEKHPAVYATHVGHLRNDILTNISNGGGVIHIDDYMSHCDELKNKYNMSYSPKNWYKNVGVRYLSVVRKKNGLHLKLNRIGKNFSNIVLIND